MLALDVTSDDSVKNCVDALLSKEGRIDVLVNSAGYLLAGAVEEATIAEAKALFETNVFGAARMVQAVLPSMRARKAGKIVVMSSLAGVVPVPFWGWYNCSKFALEGMFESLRYELKPFDVKIAIVEPGVIKTPFYARPVPAGMPAYDPWRGRSLKTMKTFEQKAPGPDVVAAAVSKIVRSANPRLRTRLTKEAKLFPLLRWLLPAGAFEAGTRRGFHLDAAGF